jgi:hypothetical protein
MYVPENVSIVQTKPPKGHKTGAPVLDIIEYSSGQDSQFKAHSLFAV